MSKLFKIFSLKYLLLCLFIVAITVLNSVNIYAQDNILKPIWTIKNPFRTDVFIENSGQYDNFARTPEPVKYVVCSDNVFFTQQGLTYKLQMENLMTEGTGCT